MGGLFGNIVQASKALMAHQVAIQVTGRNMANVNNPEYARQRVKLGDRYVNQTQHGPEGTGVEVLQVQAMRDMFLDAQVVRQASDTQSLETQKAILANFELALGDKIDSNPDAASPTGLGNALDTFFNAFSNFAANPADLPTRSAALSAAQALADRINLVDERLSAAQDDQEAQIESDVQTANGLITEIARLNFEIRQSADSETGGAIDLVDTRQAKLEKLAGLIKLDITRDPANPSELNLSIGGVPLVSQAQVVHQIGYLSRAEAAELSALGKLGRRMQGFEVGNYDQAGNFTPTVVSTGGASMLAVGDTVTGFGIPNDPNKPTIITGRLDSSTVQLSNTPTVTGFVSLTINGVVGARTAQTTSGSKTVSLLNSAGYQVIPGGGSMQGRFQAVFGNPTATYMTAKGLRSQVVTLANTLKKAVNEIYNPAVGGQGDLFQAAEASIANTDVKAGDRTVTVGDNSGVVVGMYVNGDGIPPGARVARLLGSSGIVLDLPAIAKSSATLTFSSKLLDVRADLTASELLAAPAGAAGAGANTIASKIAGLRDAARPWASAVSGGASLSARFGDYARNLVTGLAQTISSVTTRSEESNVVETALKIQRDSVSGVSLDEETADLLRFQKAYQANAKVVSVIDEMLMSLISMVR
jgi:flagellar hook-associated protein FlgK